MSRRGARSQAAEKRRLVRALRRTGRSPKGLPGVSTRKHLRPLLASEPPLCRGWNYHVIPLGASRCVLCGWERVDC